MNSFISQAQRGHLAHGAQKRAVQYRPVDSPADAPIEAPTSIKYLVMYNVFALCLQLALLCQIGLVFGIWRVNAPSHLYSAVATFAAIVQAAQLLEVIHAASGLVRASAAVTSLQVAGRCIVAWAVVWFWGDKGLLEGQTTSLWQQAKESVLGGPRIPVPDDTARWWNQRALFAMLMAWSLSDAIRYMFYIFYLGGGSRMDVVPKELKWMRYNAFFVLYPVGMACEVWLSIQAVALALEYDFRYATFLMTGLAIYLPCAYILYSHMMGQRNKALSPPVENHEKKE